MTNKKTEIEPCDRRRILVADDELEICEMFQLILSGKLALCRIDVTVNGVEAVESFRTIHHGVVILDVRMPVKDGEEAFHDIQKICKADNWEMPSFIFCTGYDPPEGVKNIVAKDPRHCILRKPVSNDVLVQAVIARVDI